VFYLGTGSGSKNLQEELTCSSYTRSCICGRKAVNPNIATEVPLGDGLHSWLQR
jgi:hypothetical protein